MQRDFGNRGLGRKTTSNIGESTTCRPGTDRPDSEFPAKSAGNSCQACQSPERRMFQWSTVRLVRRIMLLGLVLYLGAWAYRIVTRKYYVWLPGYVSWLYQIGRA